MRKVKVQEAEGLRLAHDVTEIIPGKKKDVAFRRGAVIRKADVKRLLDLGKRHIYVTEGLEREVHEEEAARRLAEAAVKGDVELLPAKEGKVTIRSRADGLVRVDRGNLRRINRVKDVLFTTVPDGYPAKAGDEIAATRIIPLSINEDRLRRAEEIGGAGVVRLIPFRRMRAGLVVTGSEVYEGRVVDGSPMVQERLEGHGLEVMGREIVPDDIDLIKGAIGKFLAAGADVVITTGGLSVDPDDVTREGIEATGAKLIIYGAPAFPGAMFAVAKLGKRYILGAPACVYYSSQTILDIVLPWVLAGEKITRDRVLRLAEGGLCQHCQTCNYPNCFFGKGR